MVSQAGWVHRHSTHALLRVCNSAPAATYAGLCPRAPPAWMLCMLAMTARFDPLSQKNEGKQEHAGASASAILAACVQSLDA